MTRMGQRVGSALRESRAGLAATALCFALFVGLFAEKHHQGAGSDGYYTWLFARSLVYDHDLDFTNDYALCGDPQHKNVLRGTTHPDNPFYVGPSVVWAPVLWGVRAVVPVPASEPEVVRQACRGPLTVTTLFSGPLLGALTVFLLYRVGRRFAPDAPAGLAAALLAVGTPLLAFASIAPAYSHVSDAFWATAAILASLRAGERPESLARWALAGALVGLDLLQRPVSLFYGAVPAVLALAALRASPRRLVAALGALGAGVLVCGVVPQLVVYKYLYGSYFVGAPAGRFFMQYAHAHPWLLLFQPHGGLFFASPVAWLPVLGLALAARDDDARPLALGTLLAAATTIWLSSAALDWGASSTYGARRLTSLVALMAAPTAILLARARAWLRARPSRARLLVGLGVLLPLAFVMTGAVAGNTDGSIDRDHGIPQAAAYGGATTRAWSFVDRVGDLAILPGEAAFALRYGLPMRSFRDAVEPVFRRDHRNMTMADQELDLTRGHHATQVTGMTPSDAGMALQGARSTLVFTTEWPYATDLTLRVRAARPTTLRLTLRTTASSHPLGTVDVDPSGRAVTVPLAPGVFDSGLLEVVFERTATDVEVQLASLRIEDRADHGPPL